MIMDENLVIIDSTAVDAVAGTAAVGDVIDLDTIGRRLFAGHNLSLVIEVTTAFTSAGSSTNAFQLVSDATTTLAADGTETLHGQTETFGKAALVIGAKIIMPVPAGLPTAERYLGLQVVTAVATTTAGSISAYFVMDAQDWAALPEGTN